MIISSAITMRKIKLERVSKPSQLDNIVSGSGNIAISRNTIGKRSHAIEFLIEIVFFLRDVTIIINNSIVAMVISICMLVMFFPPET